MGPALILCITNWVLSLPQLEGSPALWCKYRFHLGDCMPALSSRALHAACCDPWGSPPGPSWPRAAPAAAAGACGLLHLSPFQACHGLQAAILTLQHLAKHFTSRAACLACAASARHRGCAMFCQQSLSGSSDTEYALQDISTKLSVLS